jgi:hypothetical protein
MGKNRKLPDDYLLSSPYKLLLSPEGKTNSKIDLHNLPTDLNTIEAIREFQPLYPHEAAQKILITDHETLP